MRRFILATLAGLLGLAALAVTPARSDAQGLVVLTRVYAEISRNGCLTYVSQWSDGSYMIVPWVCPFPIVPLRNDAPVPLVRSYTERGREGCIWYVALWADGVFTGVPWVCPFGIAPLKPGTVPPPPRIVQPLVPAPTVPQPAPVLPYGVFAPYWAAP